MSFIARRLAVRRKLGLARAAVLVFSLAVGFCMTSDIYAAGTTDAKEDFGAVGDGVADDSDAILAAFASDSDVVIFPEGEYRFTKQLKFAAGDKTIMGERATLFTDDSYNSPGTAVQNEWAIVVRGVDNVTIRGIRIEARQTVNKAVYRSFFGVMGANNIHVDSCSFALGADKANYSMNAVDFYSGWHDVSLTNSVVDLQNDYAGMVGGAVYFRDIWKQGISGGKLINNTLYKHGHDELLWISGDQVDDIEVSGNRLYFGDPILQANVYTIGLNSSKPDVITNLRIYDNEIIGQGNGWLIALEGSVDADITNNDLYLKNSSKTDGAFSALIGSRSFESVNSTGSLGRVHHNRTATLDSVVRVGGVTYGSVSAYDFTDNPRVVINATASYLINHKGSFANNEVVVNGNVHHPSGGGIVAEGNRDVRDNTIRVNGYAPTFLRQWRSNKLAGLSGPAVYTGNTVTTTKKNGTGGTALVRMWNFSMNGYPITISDNTFVNGTEIESDESLGLFTVPDMGTNTVTDRQPDRKDIFWSMTIGDAVPADQTFNFCNNVVKGFSYQGAGTYPTVNMNCN